MKGIHTFLQVRHREVSWVCYVVKDLVQERGQREGRVGLRLCDEGLYEPPVVADVGPVRVRHPLLHLVEDAPEAHQVPVVPLLHVDRVLLVELHDAPHSLGRSLLDGWEHNAQNVLPLNVHNVMCGNFSVNKIKN